MIRCSGIGSSLMSSLPQVTWCRSGGCGGCVRSIGCGRYQPPARGGQAPGPAVHDDLVQRRFTADGRDRLWYSDITEHWTGEGKLYVCAIKDAWSNRIVGYSIDSRMKSRLAVNALRMAVARRPPTGSTVHTDRGSHFRSRGFVAELARNGLRGSMGTVGAAGDNAALESFFSLLQHNVLNTRS